MRTPIQTYGGAVAIGVVVCVTLLHSAAIIRRRTTPLSNEQARAFYAEAADREVDARAAALEKFRSSEWSQQDEFHATEAKFVREYASTHHFPVRSVLDALDRGMREKWPTPNDNPPRQTVIPCRPRLTY